MTNYDQTDLPARYDRGRDHGPEMLDLWMRSVAEYVDTASVRRILDLGCGTGRFSESLAAHFNADVVGLDPSVKMLEVARDKQRDSRVHYERGRSEEIPLAPGSVDLIFMSMSLHHVSDKTAAAQECRRVLANDGVLVIRTGTRDQISSYPFVRFFAPTERLLEETLPASADVLKLFGAAGLQPVAAKVIRQTIAPDWTVYAEKLSARGDSVLAKLSREEFDAGLAAVRDFAATDAGRQPVVELIDFFVFRSR